MNLDTFVQKLKSTYGENLSSVILYGSAAGADFQKKFSDYNIMVVLKDISLAEIGKGSNISQKWMGYKNPPPLFVDQEWMDSSHDVFPIEFSDIKETHRILHGMDPFKNMEIHNDHLRMECEEQLKGKILALREGYLRNYPSKRKIKKMMLGTVSSLIAVFKGVLRLLGESVPPTKHEVLKKLNEKTQFDTGVFDRILEVREGKRDISRAEILPWMEEYLTTLGQVAKLVDKLPT